MKNVLVSFCLLAVISVQAQTEKSIRESDIKEVKVYLQGALITRNLKTNVNAGISKISVDMLSPYINPASVNVTGTGDATILSVVHEMNYLNEQKKTPEIKSLEDSLEILSSEMQLLQNAKYILDQEESLLLENKKANSKDGVNGTTLNNLADVFIARLTSVKEKQTLKQRQIKKQQEKIDKINNQLGLIRQKYNNGTGSIVVTLSAKAATNVNLDISYLVQNAGWIPAYDLRATDTNSPLQLGYKANVYQNCGEEWNNIKLKLSTGNPTLSGTKPDLYPWYINIYNPAVYKQQQDRSGNSNAYLNVMPGVAQSEGAARGVKEEDKALSYTWSTVTVDDNQLATDFDIKMPYTIPSNGKQYLVEIQNFNMTAIYNYASVPKRDRDAFLTASVKDWEELNLIPGEASIYFQNGFVGTTSINTRNIEDSMVFSLGRDKRIIVTREKDKDFSEKTVLGGNIVKTFSYVISVKNTKKENVNITIEEQIPVSQNSEIEVKMIENSNAVYNAENGKLNWSVSVAPGETQKRKFSFSVKYPKGKQVSGL